MKRAIHILQKSAVLLVFLGLTLNAHSQHACLSGSFPLNGNGNDVSGQGNTTTIVGSVTPTDDRNAVDSGAMLFNGTTGYLNLNNGQPIITTTEFTISAWARIDGAPGGVDSEGSIFEQRDDVGTSNVKSTITLFADKNSLVTFAIRTQNNNNGDNVLITCNRPSFGGWHHYVALLGSDDTMRLYLDGVEMAKDHFHMTGDFVTSVDNVGIGVHRNFGQVKGLFNGAMDDVKFYDCGLTPQEIWSDYTTGFRSVTNESRLKLYPNPFKQSTNLQFENPGGESFSLKLIDSKGQVVRQLSDLTENEVTLYKEELVQGVYFVQLSVKNELRYSGKLVVE